MRRGSLVLMALTAAILTAPGQASAPAWNGPATITLTASMSGGQTADRPAEASLLVRYVTPRSFRAGTRVDFDIHVVWRWFEEDVTCTVETRIDSRGTRTFPRHSDGRRIFVAGPTRTVWVPRVVPYWARGVQRYAGPDCQQPLERTIGAKWQIPEFEFIARRAGSVLVANTRLTGGRGGRPVTFRLGYDEEWTPTFVGPTVRARIRR